MSANRNIATAIRRVLDRHGDVLEAYPEFVREHILARLDVGASRRSRPTRGRYLRHCSHAALGDERGPAPSDTKRASRFWSATRALSLASRRYPTGAPSRRQGTEPCGSGTSLQADACVSWRAIPIRSITSRRCPTGARARRHRTAPCGSGTSPRANACVSWRVIPERSFMSRRCPTGARSRRHGTTPCGSGTSPWARLWAACSRTRRYYASRFPRRPASALAGTKTAESPVFRVGPKS